ncbi:MAG: hypothetical protein IIT68_08240 [Treponema sp.]|nr:hypothetical protein [Treponema sp.]
MSSFDTLVSGLSDKERLEILQRMKSSAASLQLNMQLPEKLDLIDASIDIKKRLEKLSFMERIMLWIKATFTNCSIEEAYNRSRVSAYAHEIEHQYLGLIDYRHRLVLDVMLNHFQELRAAAKFFEPYIAAYEKNPGAFYVLLGSIVMPGEHADIEADIDPYAYPFTEELDPDLHSNLSKKLEDVLAGIPDARRKTMYASVASVEWLRAFVRIPFERMSSKFSLDDSGRKTCHFENMGKDFCDFASVMCNGKVLSTESLQSLFIFYMKYATQPGAAEQGASLSEEDFLQAASLQMVAISSYIRTVPTRKMVCVIANNVQFVPSAVSGGEEWFVKYKSEWKMLFEHKWSQWMCDYEKERLKKQVTAYFGYDNLPLFPYRPWSTVWEGVPFRYELSLGFAYAFYKDYLMVYMKSLKQIALAGEFAIKENRVEFTDTCNTLYQVNDDLDVLATQLSAGGEYGLLFAKYEGQETRKSGDIKTIRDALRQIEARTTNTVKALLGALHSLQSLMGGILSEHVTSYYGPLINLGRIQAKDGKNRQFVHSLRECRFGVNHAYDILTAIEPLELPTGFTG